jgi:hypothetical protein
MAAKSGDMIFSSQNTIPLSSTGNYSYRYSLPVSRILTISFLIFFVCPSLSIGRSPQQNLGSRFSSAHVHYDCGPADGIALQFHFATNPAYGEKFQKPYLLIQITENLPDSAPKDYLIGRGKTAVLASRCLKDRDCESALSGFLHLGAFNREKSVSGEYELKFKDGTVEKGNFEARWYEAKKLICG